MGIFDPFCPLIKPFVRCSGCLGSRLYFRKFKKRRRRKASEARQARRANPCGQGGGRAWACGQRSCPACPPRPPLVHQAAQAGRWIVPVFRRGLGRKTFLLVLPATPQSPRVLPFGAVVQGLDYRGVFEPIAHWFGRHAQAVALYITCPASAEALPFFWPQPAIVPP